MGDINEACAQKQPTEAQLASRERKRVKQRAVREKKEREKLSKTGTDEKLLSVPTYTFVYSPRKRYINVEFNLPEYASHHVLRIDSAEDWGKVTLTPGIKAVIVGPNAGATE
jgi:hypothetical protein